MRKELEHKLKKMQQVCAPNGILCDLTVFSSQELEAERSLRMKEQAESRKLQVQARAQQSATNTSSEPSPITAPIAKSCACCIS